MGVGTTFVTDATRGQTKHHKQIFIKNAAVLGTPSPGPRCLKWQITGANSQLKITPPNSLPVDPNCGGVCQLAPSSFTFADGTAANPQSACFSPTNAL